MKSLEILVSTVETLRSPNGCEWDKKQTFDSLKTCIIEEAYELVDAIESNDKNKLIEELGDYLLQVIMICTIASETGIFNLDIVALNVNKKMIDRHPHVFKDTQHLNEKQVIDQWEKIKETEHKKKSVMEDIPTMPSLLKAEKIQKRASRVGFDWPNVSDTIDKLEEEISEFKNALASNCQEQIEEEAGDILFSLVNVLRKCNLNSEDVLRRANKKFISRFSEMEKLSNYTLDKLTLESKEQLWQKAKEQQAANKLR